MGREIAESEELDDVEFQRRLREETKRVMGWFRDGALEAAETPLAGIELEAWLMDQDGLPAPDNIEFLERLDHPLAVPELSQFNFEFNTDPARLGGRMLSGFSEHLSDLWSQARRAASEMNLSPMMVGIPPTLREDMLNPEYMTPSRRYALLNERLFELRNGKPLNIEIAGRERIELAQDHLMMEAACTSFQIHLGMTPENSARRYNAAQIASAPLLAVCANAPFLYGRRLWEETRIPAFENAISLLSFRDRTGRRVGRVTFGSGYVRRSLLELFVENLEAYPVMLPILCDDGDPLAHLKLQNGTVWRWNRPIIHAGKNGAPPHIRMENRILPAGPTIEDMIANLAFFIGLTLRLEKEEGLETRLPFEQARANFYAAAKRGLGARLGWLDETSADAQALIREHLVPSAETALLDAGLDAVDVRHYLGLIAARALNGQTGAAWQRAHANCHGRDFQGLVQTYLERQDGGRPVHTWTV